MDYKEKISWLQTFAADLSIEFALGILVGLQTLIETGDLSQAAFTAVLMATATATLRTGIKSLIAYIKTFKK